MRLLCSLLLFATATLAAQQPLTFTETSAKDSPLKLTATGTWSESIASYVVTGSNVSGKEIVAFVLTVGTFDTIEHDHFFKAHGFEPGSTSEVDSTSDFPLPLAMINSIPLTLRFVQVADGSTWGDTQAATKLMIGRGEWRDWLVARIAAYEHGGEATLSPLLSHERNPDMIGWAHESPEIQRQSGTSAVISYMQKKLDAANVWSQRGKF